MQEPITILANPDKDISNQDYTHSFKMLLLGDTDVGKSCLLSRYVDGIYTDTFISTFGPDNKVRNLDIDGNVIKTTVWEINPQKKSRLINQDTYRGVYVLVLAFDLTNKESFNNIKKSLQTIDLRYEHNIMLVGTKSDLAERRVVNKDEIEEFQKENPKIDTYIETSAKTGDNVENVFEVAVKLVLKRITLATHNDATQNNCGKKDLNKSIFNNADQQHTLFTTPHHRNPGINSNEQHDVISDAKQLLHQRNSPF